MSILEKSGAMLWSNP